MIRLNDVSYAPILRNISLEIPDTGITGLVGPNGSGKTTLLRCLFKALKPTSGSIEIDGDPLHTLRSREVANRIAVVSQDMAEPPLMTVAELVSLGRTHAADAATDNIARALTHVGLLAKARTPLPQLSGGERQRAMIARALVQDTKYLLLDEPTNHLDIYYQLELFALLGKRQRSTVVVVHDLNLALAHCQHVHLLNDGQVLKSGSPDEVLVPEVLEPVYQVGVSRTQHHLHFERK